MTIDKEKIEAMETQLRLIRIQVDRITAEVQAVTRLMVELYVLLEVEDDATNLE